MDGPAKNADEIRARGWRQGAMLRPSDLPQEFQPDPPVSEGTLYYVLTHDCDLVQPDFEKEPYVELLIIAPIHELNGNFAFGRHPRLLDFKAEGSLFRACCHERLTLPRNYLAGPNPIQNMSVDVYTRDLIADWIAKRYTRPAFPDEFNRRIGEQAKPIQKFFKKSGGHFTQILINCAPAGAEITNGEKYDLIVWMVLVDPPQQESPEEKEIYKLVDDFGKILKACSGIRLIDCRTVTEDDVTIGHLRLFSQWDFDYLTHREALQS